MKFFWPEKFIFTAREVQNTKKINTKTKKHLIIPVQMQSLYPNPYPLILIHYIRAIRSLILYRLKKSVYLSILYSVDDICISIYSCRVQTVLSHCFLENCDYFILVLNRNFILIFHNCRIEC